MIFYCFVWDVMFTRSSHNERGGEGMNDEEKIDYGAILDRVVGNKYDDGWATRPFPNSGTKISEGMFDVSDEFMSDYAENMNERRQNRLQAR